MVDMEAESLQYHKALGMIICFMHETGINPTGLENHL